MHGASDDETNVLLFVKYKDKEELFQESEYITIHELKKKICDKFSIQPSKQIIEGWNNFPESDDTILSFCTNVDDVTNLLVMDKMNDNGIANNVYNPEMDECIAAQIFICKFINNYQETRVTFHSCPLKDAISACCSENVNNRKVLLLYFHKSEDPFSKLFCKTLCSQEVYTMMENSFFLLPWDIEDTSLHSALKNALDDHIEMSNLEKFINGNISAAFCFVPINNSLTLTSCMRHKISEKDILTTLKNAEKFLIDENKNELELSAISDQVGSSNDIDSAAYQKLMADRLGDRDYDSFEFDEHEFLKKKIGFALFGPPMEESGYSSSQENNIKKLYTVILNESNEIAEWTDRVEIAVIFNCTESLPKEKVARAEKYENYNPNTDLMPVPIFVLRKCRESDDPCRVFIDDSGRVYRSWKDYIDRNKLNECEMILPLGGRYDVNNDGEVLLERHLSPACGLDVKVLKVTDIASTVGGLASGGIFVAAAIPGIAVAPVALIAGAVVGTGVGAYSLGRSLYTLYDRSRHKETMSFANSEARGAYINIVAGSLGFVGAGANLAVSQLAMRGFNIGQGATAAVNTLGVMNISASGIGIVNSSYDVIEQWIRENRTPSLLTMVQLGSSILFFGHAVYSFRSASTIIEEAQTQAMQDYHDSLRSNRHRKMLNKLTRETMNQNQGNPVRGRAEVISAIKNIKNKDDVFAALTRNNKAMNEAGVRFAAENGEIKLNGVTIDMAEFTTLNKQEARNFVFNIPENAPVVTPAEIRSLKTTIMDSIGNISLPDVETCVKYSVQILNLFGGDMKNLVIKIATVLLNHVLGNDFALLNALDKIFPSHNKFMYCLDVVVNFLRSKVDAMVKKYETWKKDKNPVDYEPIFEKINFSMVDSSIETMEVIIRTYYIWTTLKSAALHELVEYFYNWAATKLYEYGENEERREKRENHARTVASETKCCDTCGGHYFTKKK